MARSTIAMIAEGVEDPEAVEILGRRHAALSRTQSELLAALNLAGVKVIVGHLAERLLAKAMLDNDVPPAGATQH